MRRLSFENPEMMDILNHQAIHMDQAVTYCPEYMATRSMLNYPSRTSQVIRAVFLGQMDASEYSADAVFTSILSGQGERWQNFGEKPEGFLFTIMLGRELYAKKGFRAKELQNMKETVKANKEHYLPIEESCLEKWQASIPVSSRSKTGLLLDEATFVYAQKTGEKLGTFLRKKDIEVASDFGPYFTGFDYFAAGLIDEGIEVVKTLLNKWEKEGIKKMITLTGQSQYLFTTLLSYLELETDIEFISILDLAAELTTVNAYVYGGNYYTRFLRKEKVLNELTKNSEEKPILNCPEFLPQLEGNRRKNVVGIWTPPLCAEYHPVGMPEGIEEKIFRMSLSEIKKTDFKELVVCDPYSYHKLCESGYPKEGVVYYTEILK